jgi:uncharacterized protein (TIGR02001 family)
MGKNNYPHKKGVLNMTRKLINYTSALLLAMGITATSVQAEDVSISGDLGVYSQYMWRGMQQTPSASVQGDLNVDSGMGLSANVWFASLAGPSTEFDFTVDYSGEVGDFGYSIGAIAYSYLNSGASNATEVYLGVGYGPVSATYYYTVAGSWKKDAYLDVGLGHSLMGYDLAANFGFYLPSTDVANPTAFPTTKSELGHVDVAISKDIEVGGLTFTPSFMVSFPTYTGKPTNSTQFVGGLNAAF